MIESLVATVKELPKTLEQSIGDFLERFGKDEKWVESIDDTVEFVKESTTVEKKTISTEYENIDLTDSSQHLDSESSQLTPLSDEMKDTLKEEGYSDNVIEKIGSEEEAKIYLDADVEPTVINGKDVLVKINIDLEQKDGFGQTNLERMQQGKAPLDQNGKPYELHHIGQNKDSPLAELTQQEHRGKGNDTILHDKQKESEIDRQEFSKEKAEHWKARAMQSTTNQ